MIKFLIYSTLTLSLSVVFLLSCEKDDKYGTNDNNTIDPVYPDMTIGIINSYIYTWNENDSALRMDTIQKILSTEGLILDKFNKAKGHVEFYNVISGFQNQFPGAVVSYENPILLENYGFWVWRITGANQQQIAWGYDYAELNSEGKIIKLIGF